MDKMAVFLLGIVGTLGVVWLGGLVGESDVAAPVSNVVTPESGTAVVDQIVEVAEETIVEAKDEESPTTVSLPSITDAVVPTSVATPTAVAAPALVPVTAPSANCSGNTLNCSDFSNCSQVMSAFNACPNDVHGLDRDNDGIPCESLCS